MKVKAKWAVKVNGEWHRAGDVFEVDSTAGLLGAVEVLKKEPKPVQVKTEEVHVEKQDTEPEPEAKAETTPKTARTRKKTTGK